MDFEVNELSDRLLSQAYDELVANTARTFRIQPEKKESQPKASTAPDIRPQENSSNVLAAPGNALLGAIPMQQSKPEFNYRPRMPRAEREAMEQAEYKYNRDTANNDLLMKGLGALAVAGTIGFLGRKQIGRGSELAKQYLEQVETGRSRLGQEYYKTRPSFFDPRFWANNLDDAALKKDHAVRLKEIYSNPLKLAGAAAYRLGVDNVTDASRMYGWRYNHPIAGLGDITRSLIDPTHSMSLPDRSAVGFAALGTGLAASGLAYDVTNPSELFRPRGFKQINPDSDNPRESTDPVIEVFQRFAMGRNGRPLKWAEARKDIPDLPFERYKNYMHFINKEKGPLGLGAIKYTDENLHGNPEIRMMGYPIDAVTAATAIGGGIGSRIVTTNMEKDYRRSKAPEVEKAMDIQPHGSGFKYNARDKYDPETKSYPEIRTYTSKRSNIQSVEDKPQLIERYLGPRPAEHRRRQLLGAMGGVAAGAAAGALLGHFVNTVIASNRNNPESLPDTREYGVA
jgi:hypothetical protein